MPGALIAPIAKSDADADADADGCHASVGRSIVRIEVEKRPARSRLYSVPQSSKMMLAVAQVDQPVSGLLAVAVSYVFTFSCFFIFIIFFFNLIFIQISSASLLFTFFFSPSLLLKASR